MPRSNVLRAIALAALLAPTTTSAQAGALRAPAACTYETCALRVEPAILSAPRLLRGRTGEQVGSLGMFGGGVDTLLAGPDSAAAHARRYVRDMRRSTTLGLIGTAAFVAALIRSNSSGSGDAASAALALTGAGFAIASIPFSLRAGRNLSQAVWFYNSALPTR
jgi:hypothetical protein